jgi:hypothetical protein
MQEADQAFSLTVWYERLELSRSLRYIPSIHLKKHHGCRLERRVRKRKVHESWTSGVDSRDELPTSIVNQQHEPRTSGGDSQDELPTSIVNQQHEPRTSGGHSRDEPSTSIVNQQHEPRTSGGHSRDELPTSIVNQQHEPRISGSGRRNPEQNIGITAAGRVQL